MVGPPSDAQFRERTRPPWLWLGALLLFMFVVAEVLDLFGPDWWRSVLYGAIPTTGMAIYLGLVVTEVRSGVVSWARRGGGPQIPIDQLVAIRVLSGPAMRESRKRLTPSFRLHCPIWERVGIQLVREEEPGRRREYLIAVRDVPGFLAAIDRPELITAQDHVPVPI